MIQLTIDAYHILLLAFDFRQYGFQRRLRLPFPVKAGDTARQQLPGLLALSLTCLNGPNTRPKGGFLLWIELPEQVDMVCVARQLCRMKIQVAAGSIFSASGKYRNCLRINCALPLSETYREALKQIGEAVYRAME